MIGNIIQQKRKEVGLTQAQLAELLGVSAPAVNRWEKDLSFPDATLLAPLARCLNTDLNELFSFYDSLSDKERELAVEKATRMLLEPDDEKVLTYIEEVLRQNRSDGKLHLGMAKTLYGAHLLKKTYLPGIYLEQIIKYYERALELLPESARNKRHPFNPEIMETPMTIQEIIYSFFCFFNLIPNTHRNTSLLSQTYLEQPSYRPSCLLLYCLFHPFHRFAHRQTVGIRICACHVD